MAKCSNVVVGEGSISAFALAGPTLAFTRATHSRAAISCSPRSADGAAPRAITPSAGEMLPDVRFGDYEQFKFAGWNDETVHGYVVKPLELPAKARSIRSPS